MGRLSGKVAIITGANGGMGQEAVRIFAGEGARIVACDVAEPTPALQTLIDQHEVAYVQGDLCDESLSQQVVQTALDRFGQLDVLYNNHGIMVGKPFLDTEMADFDRVVSVNLRSVFALSLYAAKAMSTRNQGSIIHISSVGGIVGFPGMAAYGASKGGLAQLARSMATDLASYNIRVNAICPGVVDTPMPRRYIKDAGAEEKETMDAMANMHLLKRNGRPEEIVWMAVYLASDESSFTTGAVIPVDGGLTAI
ncbi:dihydroanticapsin dehydrogenase [Natronocella acetinitrilica]|uniref:Dihydroanticapsin dehydrogenase n=1 Tax=Natronocella acetinitrilica TaxID=414046 RepID=A0AAE3G7A7_9GAMM|nr:SDR family oxidoreductase [Natronocella acetinitrilica]MCP1676989.1 dihydroanticapsin dehydrogenase [Natronocella acetinitrilica]